MIDESILFDNFHVFYQYLAISYEELGLIVIIDLELNHIVHIVDDPLKKFNI